MTDIDLCTVSYDGGVEFFGQLWVRPPWRLASADRDCLGLQMTSDSLENYPRGSLMRRLADLGKLSTARLVGDFFPPTSAIENGSLFGDMACDLKDEKGGHDQFKNAGEMECTCDKYCARS
jgi:hypothetical protein